MVKLSTESLLALIWASVALATPLIAELTQSHDLTARNDTVCPDEYTSENGMRFTTYCKQNNPGNDALPEKFFTSPSMADCMEHCSRYWGDSEGCYGVVWREDYKCWIRNSNTTVNGIVNSNDGTHSALIAANTYDKISATCPENDLSTHALDGVPGLGYIVKCNKVIGGFDTCWSGYQPCWGSEHLDGHYIGFYHTTTLEDCVRICTTQSPLCKGVSWNPGYEIGFANCWPKTGFNDSAISTPPEKDGVMHSVTITSFDRVDTSCPASKSYATTGNNNFDIHCGQFNEGTNLTSIHTQNITSCMDSCAITDQCVGVVFDSTLQNGFMNCHLQSTTSTIRDEASTTFAALSSSTPSALTPILAPSSESKAWIAGPVIGSLAGLGILGSAIFLWRRRKARLATLATHTHGQYDAAPAYSPGLAPHGAPGMGMAGPGMPHTGYYDAHPAAVVSEADASAARNELPETTKYAHRTGEGEVHEAP